MLKYPRAYGATSIVVCNYFVLGVKAYGATSIVEFNYFVWGVNAYGGSSIVVCKPTRPTSCGRRSRPAWAKRKNVFSWKRLHGLLAMSPTRTAGTSRGWTSSSVQTTEARLSSTVKGVASMVVLYNLPRTHPFSRALSDSGGEDIASVAQLGQCPFVP